MTRGARKAGLSRRHRFAGRGAFAVALRSPRKLRGTSWLLHVASGPVGLSRLGLSVPKRLAPHAKRFASMACAESGSISCSPRARDSLEKGSRLGAATSSRYSTGRRQASVKRALIALVRAYQYVLSPWWGGHCRFTPTCSHYAIEALERHGAFSGSWLAARRLLRCHPWTAGGYDPVP